MPTSPQRYISSNIAVLGISAKYTQVRTDLAYKKYFEPLFKNLGFKDDILVNQFQTFICAKKIFNAASKVVI